jgi:hypothetical protein
MQDAHLVTVAKAFEAFAFRLELKDDEKDHAELHERRVMILLPQWFAVERSFYGGSFARRTFGKPIMAADLFVELGYRNRLYRLRRPSALIEAFRKILVRGYADTMLHVRHGGLRIDGGRYRWPIQSINVVPILAEDGAWAIPDPQADRWLITDPHRHEALARKAHNEFSQRWRPVVQMAKCWNYEWRTPIKPAFLLEVFALDYLTAELHSSYDYQVYGLFDELAKRIGETWADPAGIAAPVSGVMDSEGRERAVEMVVRARNKARRAIGAAQEGDIPAALACYRELFGPLFPVE